MKRKCDKCSRPATHHSVEIIKGKKVEKHLCDLHAAEEGLVVKSSHMTINELLTNFVDAHSGKPATPPSPAGGCPNCGMTLSEFRETSLLGCPQCYEEFEAALSNLLERAHEGATHHVGKIPRRAGPSEHRQENLTRMRKRLADAVTAEDYELAASLRDEIRRVEEEIQ